MDNDNWHYFEWQIVESRGTKGHKKARWKEIKDSYEKECNLTCTGQLLHFQRKISRTDRGRGINVYVGNWEQVAKWAKQTGDASESEEEKQKEERERVSEYFLEEQMKEQAGG